MNTRNIQFRSNRARDIVARYHEVLDATYGHNEVSAFCEMLFEHFVGWDRVHLLSTRDETVDQSDLLRFHWALEDLKKERPIQHIIGHVNFFGCRIEVNPDVLVPRPETEEMVRYIIQSQLPVPTEALDMCTGSGCIAIALKKHFADTCLTAVDISEAALHTARRNAAANSTEIRFLQADILSPALSLPEAGYQLIVSNPPYVRQCERAQMHRNVLDYDPPEALFVPDDNPLLFYRAIAQLAQRHLAPNGLLTVEINEALADETCTVFRQHELTPAVHADFANRPRFITATRR